MNFLADTNIISAAAPTKARPDEALRAWLAAQADSVALSAITIFEIEDGIAKLARQGASKRAAALRLWREDVEWHYGRRILPVDAEVARIGGRLSDRARGSGHTIGYPDILIAATGMRHGLIVLTRNLSHFAPLGVDAIDPTALSASGL